MAGREVLRLVFQVGAWLSFLFFLVYWTAKPTGKGTAFDYGFFDDIENPVIGHATSWMIVFTAPFFLMLLLACLYLHLNKSKQPKKLDHPKGSRPKVGIWTYPVLIRSYIGIVSAADMIILALIVTWTLWIILWFCGYGISHIDWHYYADSIQQGLYTRLDVQIDYAAYYMGVLIFVPMALLFFPVSRGSPLLRLANIPFEHAVKYHKWLGVLTIIAAVLHSLGYYIYFYRVGDLAKQWKMWPAQGENNLAGLIATLCGILIGITSIPWVRDKYFELFWGVHHLYIAFVVLAIFHIGQDYFYMVLAGVFLFIVDRFLRFIQSRKTAGLISVRNLPGDTTELVFAKHPSLKYTTGSFIFVNFPALSRWWQWHPFTVTSTSETEKDTISVLVKHVGSWTKGLQKLVEQQEAAASGKSSCPFNFRATVEGPYGHESLEHLRYNNLIFVAGGSGIAPFIAFLKDLVHRHHTQNPEDLPSHVMLVWAVRKEDELRVLDSARISLKQAPGLHVKVQSYVTRQESPDPEKQQQLESIPRVYETTARRRPLCPEAGRDSYMGHLAVVAASVAGYLLLWSLLGRWKIHVTKETSFNSTAEWSLFMFSVVAGIVFFGGPTLLIWTLINRHYYLPPQVPDDKVADVPDNVELQEAPHSILPQKVFYGSRPDLIGILAEAGKELAGTDVGVLVCGPASMQESVAYGCQKQSSLLGTSVALHYHSVAFDL